METPKSLVAPLLLLMLAYCCLAASEAGARVRREEKWKITTIVDRPYTIKKTGNFQGNDAYDGYIPDLLKKIAEHLNHGYVISDVADGKYGAKGADNKWTGMIGEVVENKADIAAAAITVSDARKEVVDFTDSLMTIKPVIVMLRPSDGSEPKIHTTQQLEAQSEIEYGAVRDGTTLQLIRNATEPHLKKMNTKLSTNPDLLVSKQEDGIKRVTDSKGKYAFITESATGNYWSQQAPCSLVTFNTELPERVYAFAVKKGSGIKAQLDNAIKFLRENGELDKIKSKWWKEQCSYGGRLQAGYLLLPLAFVVQVVVALGCK